MAPSGIELSVVVRVVGGEPFLRRLLRALLPQLAGAAAEVIVPCDLGAPGIGLLRAANAASPGVTFVDTTPPEGSAAGARGEGAHARYDRRTAAGLARAGGAIVAILEDHDVPAPDWFQQVRLAHQRLPYGVIGGAVEHGAAGAGALNWAIYFLDFGRYGLPLGEGPAAYLTDVNVTYKRAPLQAVRESWAASYNEATVHWALARRGEVLWQRPQIVVHLGRERLSFRAAAVERLAWGRVFGLARARELPRRRRLLYAALSPLLPAVLVGRIGGRVWRSQRHRRPFLRALPYLLVMATCWCTGELVAYLSGCGAGSIPSGGDATAMSLAPVGP